MLSLCSALQPGPISGFVLAAWSPLCLARSLLLAYKGEKEASLRCAVSCPGAKGGDCCPTLAKPAQSATTTTTTQQSSARRCIDWLRGHALLLRWQGGRDKRPRNEKKTGVVWEAEVPRQSDGGVRLGTGDHFDQGVAVVPPSRS